MKKIFLLFLLISIKLSSQDFNYNVPSHEWKNSTQPWIDLFLINAKATSESINGESRIETSTTGVAYADFNEDGYLDILTLAQSPDAEFPLHQMLINNGDGTYSPDNTLITNPGFQAHGPRKTVVGDFNGDNKPDVVRIGGGHDVLEKSNILMSGTDNYTFSFIDVVPESQYHGFASGDLDNDGDLDLFFGEPDSGFAMNDGSGNFTWYSVDEKISNYFLENTEVIGPYGVATVEILDVNQDGNVDIVAGGAYADADYDYMLMGPTILWGDGSSNYDYDNKTEIWGFGEKPTMPDGSNVNNNDDISFADINNDGYIDVVLTYIRQIDNDPNNNGNPSYRSVLQIFKGGENNEFTDVTNEWTSNPLILLDFPVTWVLVRDVDNNGMIDIVESEKVQSGPGGWRNSIRWEWNGSSLITAEIDTDVDGVLDYVDNCPETPNSDQSDINNNGIGDVCDSDNGIVECGDTVVYTQVANGDYSTSLYAGDDLLASVTINATMEVNYDFIIVTDGAGNQLNTQDDGDFVDSYFYSTDGTITVQVLNDSGVQNGDVILAFGCVSLSIPENERLDLIIYPNPTSEMIYIKSNVSSNYHLYNMIGQKIIYGQINEGDNELNLTQYRDGIYFIKFIKNNRVHTKKIIKN
jgi:hypothetical protein